jgi:hypothetical protein
MPKEKWLSLSHLTTTPDRVRKKTSRPGSRFGHRGLEIELLKGWSMAKEKLLTVRWNNLLTLGLGIPALIYAVAALSTSLASELGGFIGLVVIGVLY